MCTVCSCVTEFMDKEIVSFLRGEIDWDTFEKIYMKCECTCHKEKELEKGE